MFKYMLYSFVLALSLGAIVAHATDTPWWRLTTFQHTVDTLDPHAVDALKVPVLIGIAPGGFKDTYGVVYSNGSVHQGEDIFAPRGAYVVSPTDAVVTRIDTRGAGGIAVYTANPGNETFYYAHMTAVGPMVTVGAKLAPGDLIGYVGNTGDAEGSSTHLHFQIFSMDGPINPYPRLTSQFTDDERIYALARIIDHSGDRVLAAQSIVRLYGDFLKQSHTTTLPVEIATALNPQTQFPVSIPTPPPPVPTQAPVPTPVETPVVLGVTTTAPGVPSSSSGVSSNASIAQNLRAGMRNDNVKVLQQYLIDKKTGQYATILSTYGATGYYGILTTSAVREFQQASNISPASGYCGPLTRAYMANH